MCSGFVDGFTHHCDIIKKTMPSCLCARTQKHIFIHPQTHTHTHAYMCTSLFMSGQVHMMNKYMNSDRSSVCVSGWFIVKIRHERRYSNLRASELLSLSSFKQLGFLSFFFFSLSLSPWDGRETDHLPKDSKPNHSHRKICPQRETTPTVLSCVFLNHHAILCMQLPTTAPKRELPFHILVSNATDQLCDRKKKKHTVNTYYSYLEKYTGIFITCMIL